MTRLLSELHRLFFPSQAGFDGGAMPSLIDAGGRTRTLVLEFGRPADWSAVSSVWQGVQRDLSLPAPAIAVSGTDAYQLWFSLADPVPVPLAQAFLGALRRRYLPEVALKRLRLLPEAPHAAGHAATVPAPQPGEAGHWSAFVAADLAPVFEDTPWLDIPPGEDGQADLLRGLASIRPAEWAAALEELVPPAPSVTEAATCPSAQTPDAVLAPATATDPREFLLQVMNDPTVALSLRIEAAKALLLSQSCRRGPLTCKETPD